MTTAKTRGSDPDPLTLRSALLANLYEPLPVRGKAAVADGWAAGELTPERLARDTAAHPQATNTGLRTGALVGVDIDVEDEREAAAIKALVEEVLDPSPLVRVGRKGMLICYQNPDPIRKITVGSSDRTKVEIMGVGQQVVAYGIHPDTRRPYEWIGEADPVTCQLDWLPVARPAALRDLAGRIATLLSERHPHVRVTGDTGEASSSAADELSSVAGVPLPPEEIRARLFACEAACDREAWRDLAASLRATPCSDPAFDRRALFVEWSRGGGETYIGDEDCETIFDTMPPKAGGLGAGTFIQLTNSAGYRGPTVGKNDQAPAEVFGDALAGLVLPATAASECVSVYPRPKSATELASGVFPRAQYALANFLLQRHVNLLYGDGGTGKTLLAQHMAVALAAGVPLFGQATMQMPVLMILAEDDDGETKARLEAIAGMMGLNLADLPITAWCLPGYDANIARVRDDGTWDAGPFMEPLRAELARAGPCFLVLDTVSDVAALDETKRLPVNTLCKVVLTGLCREFDATVLVNAHPSKAAMADGSGYAGSTAWNNAVRNRLTFERPNANSRQRILKVAKANYGQEAQLELKQIGLTFMPMAEAGQSEAEEIAAVLETTLDLIDQGIAVVRANGSGQKPADVAKAVLARCGLEIAPRRVLDHLSTLERQGRLRYRDGGNKTRGQRAGFCRPEGK